jgi:hypothetical protein
MTGGTGAYAARLREGAEWNSREHTQRGRSSSFQEGIHLIDLARRNHDLRKGCALGTPSSAGVVGASVEQATARLSKARLAMRFFMAASLR